MRILSPNEERDNGGPPLHARIRVRLTPKAAGDQIAGWQDDVLRVRVSAPPIEGRANVALERLIAKALRVPKRDVRVVAGAKGREKTVEVAGMTQAKATRLLERAAS